MNDNSDIKLSMEEAALQTARQIKITGSLKPRRVIHMLRGGLETIRDAYKRLVYSKQQITKSYEWLYDNYYILEREGRLVIKGLSVSPALPCGEGVPAAFTHAQRLCITRRGNIDAAGIEAYIEDAQKERDFESSELAAFELMLRAALIENAARACADDIAEAERELILSDAVKTLNFLTTFDFSGIVERQSRIEQIFSLDPAGVYGKMDERSREVYRKRLASIAKSRGMHEGDAARLAVELAKKGVTLRERHVGYYILENDLDRPKSRRRGKVYLMLLWSIPAAVSVAISLLFRNALLAPLLYLPVWEIARPVIEYFVLKGVPATFLPRLELEGLIPDEAATLVVISTLLTSPQKIDVYIKRLEQFYYSNGRGRIMFGILADLKEARLPEQPEDKAIKAAAVKAIKRLNAKYGSHFCVFIRGRRLNGTQGAFSGWERKRGAVTELVRFIKGKATSMSVIEGDTASIHNIKYIITLDADTGLLMDTAAEMVSVAMHPLNLPEIDHEKGIVTKGFGILAPRIGVDLDSAGITPFSRIMAGNGGVTAYDNASGDTYQDLFGEGIYSGKGIINVDAFYDVLDSALPENTVLSHDILEGCYLRAAFLSDVELIDGFPPRPGPWFDRLHRWIRGDWQNISFIGRHIPVHDGTRVSPLNTLSRFKLFDNLRRSATPVLAFLCLIAAAFMRSWSTVPLIAAAFLAVAGPGFWSALLAIAHGGFSMLSRKYHCHVLPQAVNSLAQGIMGYLFLPYHAIFAFDGIIRALWRRVSGKKLLEWTTAAEAEAKSEKSGGVFWRFWPTAVAGIAFLFAALTPAVKVAGAFFIITPLVALLSSRTMPPADDDLSDDGRETLRSYVAAMWRYYDDFVGAADHFLPPDNVQEAPVSAVAHRTSPTNIGLYMLSCLGVRDLGLIDSDNLLERLEGTVSTLEGMEKWNGHLYNWYDTLTLRPLKPTYVSTVDSGNLLCCLTALREGLSDYAGDITVAPLKVRLQKLIDGADLSVFYNKRRKLFHIGFDVESGSLSDIFYDLLMSESRMTSYFAIAKRAAPKRHWGALGRTLTRQNGYTGPVSWTGTMFEYMMPHLLLPVYEDSLSAEALRFVIYCQKHRVKNLNIPWGISESGFYSFDGALNYQYEAHGVQKLALKRGMDNELVISPYSTFIALPFDPNSCMRNLKALEDMGIYGRCGFFEAADFTYKRTEGHLATIKSYMAHHVGMSLVASVNALLSDIMQERFMRDYEMRAAQDLLQEKIPSNAVVFNGIFQRELPVKPGRAQFVREVFDEISPVTPRVHAFSNGEYTMIVTDTGASFSMFRGIDLIRRSPELLRNPLGVYAVAEIDGGVISATAAPEFLSERIVKRTVEFNSSGVEFSASTGACGISMHACLHGRMPCEARYIEMSNYTQRQADANLLIYLEPVLAKTADEAAHPAFSRLFLSASYRPDTKIIIFARRPRGGEIPAFLAIGLEDINVDYSFELDRTNLLNRPDGIGSLAGALKTQFSNKTGAVPDAAAALKMALTIPSHGKGGVTLLLTAANTADEAAARLIEARREGFHEILRGAAGKNSNQIEQRLAAFILPQILYPVKDGEENVDAKTKNWMGQSGLWSLGISGDIPIILFEYSSQDDAERVEPYVKTHRSLRLKGVPVDLAIVYREGGDYSQTQQSMIKETVKACGCEYLINTRGGIHLINLSHHPEEIYTLLCAAACHIAAHGQKTPFVPYTAARLLAAPPSVKSNDKESIRVFAGSFENGEFRIPHRDENPPAPWCHILANQTFGTLVSDRALGFTWAVNSRENKLTPWSNDPVGDNRGEMLLLRLGNRFFDLCANAAVSYCAGNAVYETRLDALEMKVTVSVPGNLMVKMIEFEIENTGGRPLEFEAAYYTEPILGVGPSTRRFISMTRRDDIVLLRNPWSPVSGCAFIEALQGGFEIVTNRADFLSGRWAGTKKPEGPDICAAVVVKKKLLPGIQTKISFVLGWAAGVDAAVKTHALLHDAGKLTKIAEKLPVSHDYINISTPDKTLDVLGSGFLRRQFMFSRIMGKTGFYQCGGAWGFRDQLQDCCAAMILDPIIAKAHIFRAAAHQFKEGDVMHWWHQLPPRDGGARGVRTRCSDDLLWLPFTVCEYLEKTGDFGLFKPAVFYLEGPELERTEEDRYFTPHRSGEKENVYLHCVRAIERAKTRGAHGLPLFGSGDWNDGMNLVGLGGSGESVWLALFLALVLERFAPVCRAMHDDERAAAYEEEAERLKHSVDETCWDGAWYLRGFYDDGAPLGGKEGGECIIDLLPQSFAVIAGMPDEGRRGTALSSALRLLSDERLRLLKLFTPPFDGGGRNPGYIRSYPPGIRENGGQYTHAAVWAALALLIEKRSDEALKILSWINPIKRTEDPEAAQTYRLEPYALAADIYANIACEGRGGWSLYTGAAGWYYRALIEYMLGIKIKGDIIELDPSLPSGWNGFKAELSVRGTHVFITVERGDQKGLTVDGGTAASIALDGKKHEAVLII